MRLKITTIGLFIILIQSCVYDFEPDISNYEDRLVVYSLISNELDKVKVNLSRTTNINDFASPPETKAQVSIYDKHGKILEFSEIEAGVYISTMLFQAIVGEAYKLHIETANGFVYESGFEGLTPSYPISDIYYDFQSYETDELNEVVSGCKFYVDAEANGSGSAHFRYEMDETYEILMPLTASYFVTGSQDTNPGEYIPTDFSRLCYQSSDISEFYMAEPNDYASKKIIKLPLTFVHDQSERLLNKYCLNVKQYNMSEATYRFWKSQAGNIGQNTLYSAHSYQVPGNIKNINNPDEVVLGIFEVSGVSNKRVFIDSYPYSSQGSPLLPQCEYKDELSWKEKLYGYYVYVTLPPGTEFYVEEQCINCELMGATPTRPDFWE